jgi:hypothetical protein
VNPVGVRFSPSRHARLVLLGEDLAHELSLAAHPDFVEDGREVIAHGVGRDVQLLGGETSAVESPRRMSLVISPSRYARP